MEWNDVIEYDGDEAPVKLKPKPTEQLARYITTLFHGDEHIGFVTNDVYQNKAGKFVPKEGAYWLM